MKILDNINIILVEPINGGNVGSVCRSINNNGINNLRIVNPNKQIDWSEAKKLACNAKPQLDKIKIYKSLKDAISDCTIVAGTTARTGFYRETSLTIDEFAAIGLENAKKNKIGIVFGREDKGLFNNEIALCTHLIQIPSHNQYKSINLSHAVMICCYELYKISGNFKASEEKSEIASSELRERMFELWKEMMIETNFTQKQKLDHMMMGLRRIFTRTKLTIPDTKILMGLAKQTLWITKQYKNIQRESNHVVSENKENI